jgi:hypothetical protein
MRGDFFDEVLYVAQAESTMKCTLSSLSERQMAIYLPGVWNEKPPEQLDLFGAGSRSCAHCGQMFAVTLTGRSRGRPGVTCSAACRMERAKGQRREWEKRSRASVQDLASKPLRLSPAGR